MTASSPPTRHPFPSTARLVERGKIVSAREAVRLIRSGDTLATSGFVGIGFAEEVGDRARGTLSSKRSDARSRI